MGLRLIPGGRVAPLYHWSPRERRESILEHGLVIGSPAPGGREFGAWSRSKQVLCFSDTPSRAWGLSLQPDEGEWDLWMVRIPERIRLHKRTDAEEWRIFDSLRPNDLWYVATRDASRWPR